ncbi:MAG TPA: CoA transferase [Steroidobacteraceae bacterium]|jgi:crotonobetainyl-CoA:carnitine CoA-transferase CaiB-like acyl-CoA transferase|nr:CoA transferase [Steroidobacteraceae bacterium]
MKSVLSGIRVVEQGTFITGPCAGMMLADLGADVVKVESPTGDPYRSYQGGQFSPHFQAYNRNKRSIALDLNGPADRKVFDELIASADVYIQNFRPGTADRLGAGRQRLQELNPKLIYCSISGFGASGPYADRPSYDSVAQALSGFLSVVVDPERPRFLGPALADAITGIYAAYGVLGALFERSRTGRGRLVEVSMLEAMAHFAVEPFAAFFALDRPPTSSDRPRLAQAYILRTADGGLIAIHLSSLEKFWEGLVSALAAPHIGGDERFRTRQGRIDHYEALGAALDAEFSSHPLQHWVERLGSNDVPFAPIHRIDEVVQDPQVRHLGLVVPVERAHGGKQAVRPAVQFDGARATGVTTAPLLDEHGPDIRRALTAGTSWS